MYLPLLVHSKAGGFHGHTTGESYLRIAEPNGNDLREFPDEAREEKNSAGKDLGGSDRNVRNCKSNFCKSFENSVYG
jgi:hypothetical protein